VIGDEVFPYCGVLNYVFNESSRVLVAVLFLFVEVLV